MIVEETVCTRTKTSIILNQVSMQLKLMEIVGMLLKQRELKRANANGIGKVKEQL